MAHFKPFHLIPFMIVTFFASFIHTELLSLQGCPRKCGNITIPFPFGMNPECSFDVSFDIFCNTSFIPPRPFLGNAEVAGISVNGKMKILRSSSESGKVSPVVVYWVAGKTSCHVAGNGSTAASRYACQSPHSQCRVSSLGRGHICRCSPGFRGNPYLVHGCQDIDECAESNPCEGVCINTEGRFKCYCPKGSVGDGRRDGTGCHIQVKTILASSSSFYLGIFLVAPVLAITWIVWTDRRKKLQKLREEEFERNGGNLLLSRRRSTMHMALYTDQDMESITNKYSSKSLKLSCCCHGGFYHGTLPNNGRSPNEVVVMVMKEKVPQPQLKQFVDQLIFLSQPQNKNVVRIIGCCLGRHSPLIVYEPFHGDGAHTLNECTRGGARFSCKMRVKAAAAIAGGLAYLNSHKYSKKTFVHGNICSANIFMDGSYNAKIFYAAGSNLISSSGFEENCVFKDPEFVSSGRLNKKSDVYSFGVVLVELLTGGRTLSPSRRGNDRDAALDFVYLFKAGRLSEILDEQMSSEEDGDVVREIAVLAEKCLNVKPSERPNMKEVEAKLSKLMQRTWANS